MTQSTTTNRRYWTVLTAMPAPMLTALAQLAESRGIHGVFAPQVYGPPFVTLAAIAEHGPSPRHRHSWLRAPAGTGHARGASVAEV